jgi:L-ascorbate metabolism protein UlaG (beta-lactamase superfamily)
MQLRLIRHATLLIDIAGQRLLVDPLLAEPRTLPSLTVGASAGRNPTTPLPCPVEALIEQVDLLAVSHAHFDHFDTVAKERLSKHLPLLCQPADQKQFQKDGFTQVIPVEAAGIVWKNLRIALTGGRHGQGWLGRAMGPVAGFVLQAAQEPTVYIAGDTVWGTEVQAALAHYQPQIVILNAGAAQFNVGAPITMTAEDVVAVCRTAPAAKVVAVHMEAINHCRMSRATLAAQVQPAQVAQQVIIPADGETLTLAE